jgi:hypothetical protein
VSRHRKDGGVIVPAHATGVPDKGAQVLQERPETVHRGAVGELMRRGFLFGGGRVLI